MSGQSKELGSHLEWIYLAPWRLVLDAALGLLGLIFCFIMLIALPFLGSGQLIFAALFLLFAWFTARAIARFFRRYAFDAQAFYSASLFARDEVWPWQSLKGYRLRKYPAQMFKDKQQRTLQLRLNFHTKSFEIDSDLKDFSRLCCLLYKQEQQSERKLKTDELSRALLEELSDKTLSS